MTMALADAGWSSAPAFGRGDDVGAAAEGVDVVVIATPDAAIAEVAAAVRPVDSTVVVHLSGSLGLDVLAPHQRRGSLHPLLPLPSPEVGARRLRGAVFAVAGDPMAARLARSLEGRVVEIDDDARAAYHAAACIASNHLVVLLAQVERVAATAGVPLDAYLDLVRATVENVAELGPEAALTGPAARGDLATLERHRAALDPAERPMYDLLAGGAADLAGRREGPSAGETT
ncbi:MAG: DUF2520 domain-containing protein [Acidimicrobiia bacterium]|nr:DUF2520 domain-containing protein [Acidimicrobiia bacterium]MCC5954362.1 DUF2520 domain-containing protein [Acidimicrobiia bacterium]